MSSIRLDNLDYRDFFDVTVEGVEFIQTPRPVWYEVGSLGTLARGVAEIHFPTDAVPVVLMGEGTDPIDRAWAATVLQFARTCPTRVLTSCECPH